MRKWLSDFMGFTAIATANATLIEENKALHFKCFQLQNDIILLNAAKRNADSEPEVKRYTNWQAFQQDMNAMAEQRQQSGN
jgi:hypothetical protein